MGTTARLDRFVLVLLGLLLTAAGALGLLAGFGAFGGGRRHRAVFDNPVGRFFGDHGDWLWPVLALVGLCLGYLALRWLLAQLTPTAVRDLQLEPQGRQGRTELSSAAVTEAVSEEIRGYRGVSAASARLTGDEVQPELALRVQLDGRADVAALRSRIERDAIGHARQALDNPDLPVRLDLVVTDRKAARVA